MDIHMLNLLIILCIVVILRCIFDQEVTGMLTTLAALAFGWVFEGIGLLVSYIANTNVFPKPLSPKEEKVLLE